MSIHLERSLEDLKTRLVSFGDLVEEAVANATRSVLEGDADLARTVQEGDSRLDALEVEIEEACLKILALYQPFATELRFLVTVLKVNNDLERMGDLAVNIAERVVHAVRGEKNVPPDGLIEMIERVRTMLRECLQSLVRLDVALAREVTEKDDEVDRLHREIFKAQRARMMEDRSVIPVALDHMSMARSLERIADLATNVSEDVLYLVQGQVVRHQMG